MENYARLGLIGKHPGYGDFLRAGLSEAVAEGLDGWLTNVLPRMSDSMGNDWAAFWDGAQDLRFWIGRSVLGHTLAGVLRPWRDSVGRRYPFILLAEGVALSPPMVSPDQNAWDIMTTHLDEMKPGQGGTALLQNLQLILPAEESSQASVGPTVWAHHPEGDLKALLASAGPVDDDRARLDRSYWWAPGAPGRAAVWLGSPGLPGPQALTWLLGGIPA